MEGTAIQRQLNQAKASISPINQPTAQTPLRVAQRALLHHPHITPPFLPTQGQTLPEADGFGVQAHVTRGLSVCALDLMARFDAATAALNNLPVDGSVSNLELARQPRKMWVTENDVLVSVYDAHLCLLQQGCMLCTHWTLF